MLKPKSEECLSCLLVSAERDEDARSETYSATSRCKGPIVVAEVDADGDAKTRRGVLSHAGTPHELVLEVLAGTDTISGGGGDGGGG